MNGSIEILLYLKNVMSDENYGNKEWDNSNSPIFVDQQIIFIHEQPALDEGEIGIFCLNNDAYLKKLGRGCLISLNPQYAPIPIREHDEFKVFGKVIG